MRVEPFGFQGCGGLTGVQTCGLVIRGFIYLYTIYIYIYILGRSQLLHVTFLAFHVFRRLCSNDLLVCKIMLALVRELGAQADSQGTPQSQSRLPNPIKPKPPKP